LFGVNVKTVRSLTFLILKHSASTETTRFIHTQLSFNSLYGKRNSRTVEQAELLPKQLLYLYQGTFSFIQKFVLLVFKFLHLLFFVSLIAWNFCYTCVLCTNHHNYTRHIHHSNHLSLVIASYELYYWPYFWGEYIPLFGHPVSLHFSRQSLHLLSTFTLYAMLYIILISEILLWSCE